MEGWEGSNIWIGQGTHIQSLRPSICKSHLTRLLHQLYRRNSDPPFQLSLSASYVSLPYNEPSPNVLRQYSSHPRTRKEVAWGEGRALILHSCCWHSGWNKEKDLKVPSVNHPAPSICFLPCLPHLASPLLSTLPLSSSRKLLTPPEFKCNLCKLIRLWV